MDSEDHVREVIRITRDEALSSHTDDLLRRQMSLHGERGVTRDRGRWYYRNWFVLAVAGLVAAVAAWAVIEPRFNDLSYVQGPVTIELNDEPIAAPASIPGAARVEVYGVAKIGEDRLLITSMTEELRPDQTAVWIEPQTLEDGREFGVYVDVVPGTRGEPVALARYLVRDPPAVGKGGAGKTLVRQQAGQDAWGMLFFPIVAGFIGLAIGGVDGLICRLPRRALLAGVVGLLVGAVGGLVSGVLGSVLYSPLTHLATEQMSSTTPGMSSLGFLLQMFGRTIAWGLSGSVTGLGQGVALRSQRLVLFGLIGGVVGGLLGGLLFDPIDMVLLGPHKPSAWLSRLVGLAVIGIAVGAMIGVVELLARDSWLRMTEGPLAGKEFLLFKDLLRIGASPHSDIYLFNDPQVLEHHATLRAVGDDSELESADKARQALVNGRPVDRARLRHGDQITMGRTVFVYQRRQG